MTFSPANITALVIAASFAAGLNIYATVLTLGLLARTQWVALPPGLDSLGHTWVLVACGIMFAIEFVADKIPAVRSGLERFAYGRSHSYRCAGGLSRELAVVAADADSGDSDRRCGGAGGTWVEDCVACGGDAEPGAGIEYCAELFGRCGCGWADLVCYASSGGCGFGCFDLSGCCASGCESAAPGDTETVAPVVRHRTRREQDSGEAASIGVPPPPIAHCNLLVFSGLGFWLPAK